MDYNGNYLAIDITIEGKRITLLAIYGPNEECLKCYENMSNINFNSSNDGIMIGYFNLVLEPSKDHFNY